ncbi:MAG: DMT family transporter [Sulfitobacter sp.]|nr:DMT family transporter [Sulfitobacter sp.]
MNNTGKSPFEPICRPGCSGRDGGAGRIGAGRYASIGRGSQSNDPGHAAIWHRCRRFASVFPPRGACVHLPPRFAADSGACIGQFAVLIALLNLGLQSVSASQGGVIFATFPLVTILLAALLGRERLTVLRVLGALISFGGVAICLGASDLPSSVFGAVLIFASACVGALCAVFYRPYLQRYPTLQIGTLAMFAATVALIPGTVLERPITELSALSVEGWALVVFIGLASGAGYLLWLTALKITDAGEATVLMGLSPITAALVGALLLGEPIGPVFIVGLVLALSGISLAVLNRG